MSLQVSTSSFQGDKNDEKKEDEKKVRVPSFMGINHYHEVVIELKLWVLKSQLSSFQGDKKDEKEGALVNKPGGEFVFQPIRSFSRFRAGFPTEVEPGEGNIQGRQVERRAGICWSEDRESNRQAAHF